VLWLLSIPSLLGATVYGNVYDLSLKKVEGAILEVNTTPAQFFIARDGTYSFEVPRGVYEITAKERENGNIAALESRNITVLQDGKYVIDFILFPVIEEEDFDVDVSAVAGSNGKMLWVGVVVILAAGVAAYLMYYKKPNEEKSEAKRNDEGASLTEGKVYADDEYVKTLLDIIKKHGSRATQKDIRKELPLSEAKISLLIAELEHKGKIEKIKKGRGNIIILK
jgi:uncharacterized membrane protein